MDLRGQYNLHKFFIQPTGSSWARVTHGWEPGIYLVGMPYIPLPELKEPYKNEWYDQNGDEEYVAPSALFYQSQEITLEFGCDGATELDMRHSLKELIYAMTYKGTFSFYTEAGNIGRQNCRYVGYETTAKKYRIAETDGVRTLLLFKIKIKVNDPITEMTLTYDEQNHPQITPDNALSIYPRTESNGIIVPPSGSDDDPYIPDVPQANNGE